MSFHIRRDYVFGRLKYLLQQTLVIHLILRQFENLFLSTLYVIQTEKNIYLNESLCCRYFDFTMLLFFALWHFKVICVHVTEYNKE